MPDRSHARADPGRPIRLAVVGGGPAGLFAAISFAERGGDRAVVLEKKERCGRKLLVSGSGSCNVTHGGDIAEFEARYGGHGRFIKPCLRSFTNRDLVAWLEARGVPCAERDDGKVFPASNRALDVLDALTAECGKLGVAVETARTVASIERRGNGFLIRDSGGGAIESDAVVLACGGRSWPVTGSEGDGYALAASLGHTIVEPRPALTSVTTGAEFVSCAGIALPDARLRVTRHGKTVAKGRGPILFTHKGLSGPGVLDLSRDIRPGDVLEASLGNFDTAEAAGDALADAARANPMQAIRTILRDAGLAASLADALLAAERARGELRAAELGRDLRLALARSLSGRAFAVKALGGWDEAMCTAGGVALDEVDPKTMESRVAPGLFFAGELLDVDGDTGGYNLQLAFSSGRLAGLSAAARAARSDRTAIEGGD